MGVKTIFELEDRISKRLKRINGELGHTEKIRKRIEKPMIISAEDRASVHMKRIEKYFLRKALKAHNINVGLHDRATKGMQRMNRYLKRNMPRSHEITMRAIDRLTPMASSLKRNLQRKFGKEYEYVIQAKDQVSKTVRRVASFTRKQLEKGYTVSLRAIDLVSRTVGRISSYARSSFRDHSMRVRAVDMFTASARRISHYANTHLNRTVTITVKVADLATKPIRGISKLASSTGALLGVGAGTYGGVVKPLQMVAGRQNMTSAFETLLGDAEKAQQRLDELVTFAGETPFKRDDIFEASRVLQVFTGDALSTAEGLRLVGDVAAGTQTDFGETAMWFGRMYDGMASGRPIGDATARLQEMGAISGEARARLEDLAESGRDITSIWPEATKEFERFNGQMEKMSNNLANLWLGVTSMINERVLMAWGTGLSDAFQPMLERFREWRGEYSFILDEMENFFNRAGKKASSSFVVPLQAVGSFANEQLQILFPGGDLTEDQQVKLQEKFEKDPEFEKRYNALEEYRNMDFEARWNIVWPNVQQEFMEWWRDTGAPGIVAGAESVGGMYGNVMGGLIRGILGIEDESGNEFIDTGALAGRSFVEGFLEAIDPIDLSSKLTKKWASTNVDFVTGNGDFGSFLLNNLLAGLLVSKIVKPLRTLGKGAGKLKDGALWGYNTLRGSDSKKGRGGSGWFGRESKTERAQRRSEEARAAKSAERASKPSYQERMKQMSREMYPPTGANDPKAPPKSKWPKLPNFPGMSTTKSPTIGGGWMNAGKGIPLLGTALGAAAIATAPEDEKLSTAGSVFGGMAGGAATGALVGSVFPGIGTIIGGILGSIFGALGGEALANWLGGLDWSGIGSGIKDAWNSSMESIKSGATTSANWISEKFSAAGDWISEKWSVFATWFYNTIWSPIATGATIAGTFISEQFNKASDWISEKWSTFAGWMNENVWTPVEDGIINVMNFGVGLWTKLEEAVKEIWGPFATWFDETIWSPIKESSANVKTWFVEKFDEGLLAIQVGWAVLSTWFDETIWTPLMIGVDVVKTWIGQKFDEGLLAVQVGWMLLSTWFDETVWTPLSEAATSFKVWISEKFDEGLAAIKLGYHVLSTWFDETVWQPLSTAATAFSIWIGNKFDEGLLLVQIGWQVISSWFEENVWTPLSNATERVTSWFSTKFDEGLEAIKEPWSAASAWFEESVWNPITDKVDSVKESIVSAFEDAWGTVSGIWDNITGAWNSVTGWFSDTTKVGEERTGVSTSTSKTAQERQSGPHAAYANGGIITKPHLGLVGEAGDEAIIPLSASRRSRALDLYEQTGKALGVQPYANGGLVGGSVNSNGSQSATVHATVGIGQVQAKGIEKEAGLYGKAFSESVASGINGTVVSMDAWKQKNVQQPMTTVMQEAVGFGSSTVRSFSTGQNATPTNTNNHLEKQVRQPFQVIEGGASKWGTSTVNNFRTGQNGTQTGTQPYLQTQVHKPFDDTQAKGSGWGTGTMTEFVSGMRSQNAQVKEAAQFLADTVESTFKERLGIHSPSRVMAGLGEWASLGIIKGLDSVDLKKFANKQVDGLISAYTGMAPDFGSPFTMTSGYGPRKSPGGIGSTNHRGLDFAAPMGTPIPAQAPGQVTFSGWQGGYGNLVKILGADGIEYLYGHNSKNLVKKGDLVSGGQTIGLVGSTGNSTGPHVHYETRRNGQAFNPMGGGNNLFSGSGASTRSAIAQAALATGVGKDWIDPLMTIAMKESGGNARAVNNWDSNARRGTPSKGLMQTIDPTFNAHKLQGMDDIYNPVHNAAAAIKYIQSRYGDISNVPGIRSMRNGGAYRGYANGGLITNEQIARIGEGGQREWIIPEERGIRGRYLLGRAAQALGMEVYDPEDDAGDSDSFKEHAAIATGQNQQKVVTTSGGISITIEMNGDQHFHTPQDEDEFLQKMKRMLIEELQEELDNGSGGAQGA